MAQQQQQKKNKKNPDMKTKQDKTQQLTMTFCGDTHPRVSVTQFSMGLYSPYPRVSRQHHLSALWASLQC